LDQRIEDRGGDARGMMDSCGVAGALMQDLDQDPDRGGDRDEGNDADRRGLLGAGPIQARVDSLFGSSVPGAMVPADQTNLRHVCLPGFRCPEAIAATGRETAPDQAGKPGISGRSLVFSKIITLSVRAQAAFTRA
jgi:hypothetical protein